MLMNPWKVILLHFVIPLCLIACNGTGSKTYVAEKGIIDLSDWDPTSGAINLNGDWEFCWDRFVSPNAEEKEWKENCSGYFPVPSYWKFYEIAGKNLPPDGKATYRLKIKLPIHYNGSYGLRWTEILSAFKMYMKSDIVAQVGQVGSSYETMTPQLKPDRAFLGNLEKEVTIVLWVSNFNHENHGIWQPIYFGEWEEIRNSNRMYAMLETAGFASICLMGLYHIILFFFRRGSKEYLYFGLFCILMGIRQLHNENHTFYPNLIIKRTLNKSSTIGSSRRSRIRF